MDSTNKIAIAVDTCIGKKKAKRLEELGYKIVVRANEAETDESWVNRAFAENAIFVISADLDIPRILEREKYPMSWIHYPNHETKDQQVDLVSQLDKSIKFKIEFFKDMTAKLKKA